MDILVKLVGITLEQNEIQVLDMENCGKKLNVCISAQTTAKQLRRLKQIFPGVVIDIDPADSADCPEIWITITKGGK